jgi:hypothetical protein
VGVGGIIVPEGAMKRLIEAPTLQDMRVPILVLLELLLKAQYAYTLVSCNR